MIIHEELLHVFKKRFGPKPSTSRRMVGLECEFPVVHKTGEAVNYNIIRGIFPYLQELGFGLCRDEGTGETVVAEMALGQGRGRFGYEKDRIGTDLGYCTIELSLTPEDNLFGLASHFDDVMRRLIHYFDAHQCFILGYGVQPLTPPGRHLLANKGRFSLCEPDSLNRFIDPRDGLDLHVFTTSAASHCHVDIYAEEAIRAVNAFNSLSGLQIALSANSPIWKGAIDPHWKAIREVFWDYGWTNRLEQTGMPKWFDSFSDYLAYICGFRPLILKRNGEYFRLLHKTRFIDFLLCQEGATGERVNGETVLLFPEWEDVYFHAGFAWFNARLAPAHGTLEARVFCQQPPGETLAVPALVLGLVENLEQVEALVAAFSWPEWKRLRSDALQHTFRASIGGQNILPLVRELLHIAESGLQKRGLKEEVFLKPFFERVEREKPPADEAIDTFETAGLDAFLRSFSFSSSE
jgi:gamma-glutamylcysteine synthetase